MPTLAAAAVATVKGVFCVAEYTATALQTVDADQNILFTETPVPCRQGYVIHRDGSGVFTLRGITKDCAAIYRIEFNANIAIPDGGTVAPISVALSVDGETLLSSLAIFTPAAADEFGNVTVFATVRIPRGCCTHVAVVNATTPDAPIDVANANIEITRI